ncbi:MAG: hypothetical protein WD883_00045 [Candidatus Colwellbacteria bacterium]
MATFKVLEEFVLNGVIQKKDSVIELDSVKAGLKSIQNFIVATPRPDNADNSVLGNLVVGKEMTPEDKAKLAEENERITAEAHEQAAKQQEQDNAGGRSEPPVQTIANALKEKLEKEEFENTPKA